MATSWNGVGLGRASLVRIPASDVVAHARWLLDEGIDGVASATHDGRPLPEPEAALRGAFALLDELTERETLQLVAALWALWSPRPLERIAPEVWRKLFALSGPIEDEREWIPPLSLALFRGARDEMSARGWSWTTEPAVARFHAEGWSPTNSGGRHRSPRIFTTEAPRAALLASFPVGGEHEVVVDPDQIGEVIEIPRGEWRETFPRPIRVRLPNGQRAVAPDCPPWDRYP